MPRKVIAGFLLIASLCLSWTGLRAATNGAALLDKFILTFRQMAETGRGGRDVLFPALDAMMNEAKQAKSQGAIDAVFFNRYQRLLMLCKLSVIEDPAGVLLPLADREIADFILDVKGERMDDAGSKSKIGMFADAIAEEIINLQMYLDGQKEKARLKEKFMGSFAPAKR